MSAPTGNQFWKLRSKNGRDKLFATPELLWQAATEYFQWCEDHPIEAEDNKGTKNVNIIKFNRPFTMKGFCIYIDASEHWIDNFKKTASEDFLYIIYKIEAIIYNQKFEGAIVGIYNANIIARSLGLKERSDITSDDDKINITFTRNGTGN
jgi:hypothetical protein